MVKIVPSQQTNTSRKAAKGTLEEGVKYGRSNIKYTRTTSFTSFWCLYCELRHISHYFLAFLLLTLNMCFFAGVGKACENTSGKRSIVF